MLNFFKMIKKWFAKKIDSIKSMFKSKPKTTYGDGSRPPSYVPPSTTVAETENAQPVSELSLEELIKRRKEANASTEVETVVEETKVEDKPESSEPQDKSNIDITPEQAAENAKTIEAYKAKRAKAAKEIEAANRAWRNRNNRRK